MPRTTVSIQFVGGSQVYRCPADRCPTCWPWSSRWPMKRRDMELARMRAIEEYRRWHCPGCDREFDTHAFDIYPYCCEDVSLPF